MNVALQICFPYWICSVFSLPFFVQLFSTESLIIQQNISAILLHLLNIMNYYFELDPETIISSAALSVQSNRSRFEGTLNVQPSNVELRYIKEM